MQARGICEMQRCEANPSYLARDALACTPARYHHRGDEDGDGKWAVRHTIRDMDSSHSCDRRSPDHSCQSVYVVSAAGQHPSWGGARLGKKGHESAWRRGLSSSDVRLILSRPRRFRGLSSWSGRGCSFSCGITVVVKSCFDECRSFGTMDRTTLGHLHSGTPNKAPNRTLEAHIYPMWGLCRVVHPIVAQRLCWVRESGARMGEK